MPSKVRNKLIFIGVFTVFLLGCNSMNQFSPETVISNALAAENEVSYYGEMEMSITGVDGIENLTAKEWRKNDKSRVEMIEDGQFIISVSDGKTYISFDEEENSAILIEDESLQQQAINPKQQVELILQFIRETHDVETVGEEKVKNRDTFHLVAKKQADQKSLIGDLELWIDKEHWLVLKLEVTTGNMHQSIEYSTIDFNQEMDDSLFQLDLPEDVEITTMDDLNEGFSEEEITLNDIPEKIGEHALYIPENEMYTLDTITYHALDEELSYADVTLDYTGKSGLPSVSLSIMVAEEENATGLEAFESEIDKVNIRNTQGEFFDFNELRMLNWSEDGLNYSIQLIDEKVTLNDVLALTKEMKEIK